MNNQTGDGEFSDLLSEDDLWSEVACVGPIAVSKSTKRTAIDEAGGPSKKTKTTTSTPLHAYHKFLIEMKSVSGDKEQLCLLARRWKDVIEPRLYDFLRTQAQSKNKRKHVDDDDDGGPTSKKLKQTDAVLENFNLLLIESDCLNKFELAKRWGSIGPSITKLLAVSRRAIKYPSSSPHMPMPPSPQNVENRLIVPSAMAGGRQPPHVQQQSGHQSIEKRSTRNVDKVLYNKYMLAKQDKDSIWLSRK